MIQLRQNTSLRSGHKLVETFAPDLALLYFPLLNILLPLSLGILWGKIFSLSMPYVLPVIPVVYHGVIQYCFGIVPVFCILLSCFFLIVTDSISDSVQPTQSIFGPVPLLICLILGIILGEINSFVLLHLPGIQPAFIPYISLLAYVFVLALAAICFWPCKYSAVNDS